MAEDRKNWWSFFYFDELFLQKRCNKSGCYWQHKNKWESVDNGMEPGAARITWAVPGQQCQQRGRVWLTHTASYQWKEPQVTVPVWPVTSAWLPVIAGTCPVYQSFAVTEVPDTASLWLLLLPTVAASHWRWQKRPRGCYTPGAEAAIHYHLGTSFR